MTDAAEIQLCLPFESTEEKQVVPELPHFDAPRNDNERLLQMQFEYKQGSRKALEAMYELSIEVCMKIIQTIGKDNRHIGNMSLEEKKIKARDAASYIPEQYLKNSEFSIKKNFPGYLYLRVQHELFYRRKVDGIVDFVDLDEFYKEGTEDEEDE